MELVLRGQTEIVTLLCFRSCVAAHHVFLALLIDVDFEFGVEIGADELIELV